MDITAIKLDKHLENLNEAQLEAVNNLEGPLLALAGAGTGKTKVLTSRIAHIIVTKRAYPSQVLAVTFTNKAAKEMIARIGNIVDTEGLWLGTFHSISAKILRRHGQVLGLDNNFTIIDTDDQLRLLKTILTNQNIDVKKYNPKTIMGIIQRWKDLGISYDKVSPSDITSYIHQIAFHAYKEYQKRLATIGSVDFGDLLLYNLELFTKNQDILELYHNKFRYILVDEYQDTNVSQYLWLRLLAQSHKNICCVGDEDQSIYGWRGAEIANILRFEQDFPGAKVIRLERNYRSTNHILSAASGIISNNRERLGKTLWTDIDNGHKVKLLSLWDDREEARFVASEISTIQRNDELQLRDSAILVRAGFQTRAFEECFISHAIPYKVIGGLRFYERMEIRDIIAYIRVTMQNDDDLAFERIINTPKRSIGQSSIRQFYEYARLYNISLFKAIEQMLEQGDIKSRAKTILSSLIANFKKWQSEFNTRHHAEVVDTILKESGYLSMWQQDKSIEAEGRIENIKELLRALNDFENITEFLEHVSLISENESADTENMVNIMTLHAAKGLEFDTVFLPGWEEGIFPHQKSLDEKGIAGLEEERRLAYVGITRAKRRLYISCAGSRRIYNQYQTSIASRFINELPRENIEILNGRV
ncbi:MAG: ATP-dependent helicase [Alphaproteobacteria bacterium]